VATWEQIREYIMNTYAIERDFGPGFMFWVESATGRYLILAAKNKPQFGNDEYITFESMLGPAAQVNLLYAAQSSVNLLGGTVCVDGMVSLRDNRSLETITLDGFATCVGYLVGATEGYLLSLE
jgi:hypothetical protein